MLKIKTTVIVLMFFMICFSFEIDGNNDNIYIGNTWGNKYEVGEVSPVYYNFQEKFSIYTLEKNDEVYCYDREIEDLLFCWYVFDKGKEPIAGWVHYRNLEKTD